MVISDEIYERLLYDNAEHVSPASLSAEAAAMTITVSGFSKSYSMTGWRIGTLAAHPKVVQVALRLQEQMTSNSTTFAQYGALAALQNKTAADSSLGLMQAAFDARRQLLLKGLRETPGITCQRAQGAFYLFPNISALGLSSEEFANRILEEEKVALVPGSGFGIEGYIRFSYATSEDIIKKGLERFQNFCGRLS
jgi:aspartate aminotransferase